MRRELIRKFIVILLIISMVAVPGTGFSAASSEPVISVEPERVEDKWPGETFTVNVTIADITEEESLYGWEFALNFSSSILNVTSIEEGQFLSAAGITFWTPYIDNEAGTVGGSSFLFTYPPTGAYGSGVLANITFYVKALGETPLAFAGHILRHYDGTELLAISHTSVDGFFTNLHNIAITDVVPSPDAVPAGESVSIDVTVANIGNFTETFNVTTYYDDNFIETQTDIILENGTSTTLTFTWNTTGVPIDTTHVISANATEVPNEIDTADNVYINGEVKVKNPLSPVARFNYSPGDPIVYQPVTFDASNSTSALAGEATIISYNWDFGDGINVNETDPVTHHNYTVVGDYNATLTVTNNYNLTDSTLKPIIVKKQNSTISISASPTTVPGGGSTTISGSIDPKRDGVNVTIQYNQTEATWMTIDNTVPETVTTDKNGQYSCLWNSPLGVHLVRARWDGDEDTFPATSDSLTIKVLLPPTASFSVLERVPVNESVTFLATEVENIVTYEWDFGDNTPSVSENDSTTFHTFTAAGTYNVTLTVTDNEGLKGNKTKPITVLQPPTATFTYSPQPPPAGENITFDASESYDDNEIISYEWDFGDNITEVYKKDENLTAIATHVYAETGNYTVRLVVTDNDNLTHTVEQSIIVVAPPSNVILYAVAGVAAAITVVTVAVYFLKIKKTKPT